MKYIQLVLATTAFLFLSTAQAHEITVAVGGISSTLNSEQNYVSSTQTTDEGVHSAGTHTSLGGEASLGYIWNVNNGFDIGFEFYYDFVNDLQVRGASGLLNTVDLMYGVRLLPGFKITDKTKIYIDLGYNLMDVTLDVSDANDRGYIHTSKDFNHQGSFEYGAGVETMIYDNLGLRFAYTVQQTSEIKFESDDKVRFYTATPTVYNFFFGITYHIKWG